MAIHASDTCGICGKPTVSDFTYRINPHEPSPETTMLTVSLCQEHEDERQRLGDQAFYILRLSK